MSSANREVLAPPTGPTKRCGECEAADAKMRCEDCKDVFCENCCIEVHKHRRNLDHSRIHVLSDQKDDDDEFFIPLSNSMKKLGTETAYAVSLEAGQLAAAGKKIYPFHIGDLNFKSPAHAIEALKRAVDEGKTGYCAAMGIPALREAIAKDVGEARGVRYDTSNVLVQPGGKPVIMKFLHAVMNPGDDVMYPSPGYPIYESAINFLGGVARPYLYKETEDGFEMDMEYIEELLTRDYSSPSNPDSKKIFIFNNHQNPMGICCTKAQLSKLAQLCVDNNVICLSDEPYFDIVFDQSLKLSIVSEPHMKSRTVILYTMSKFAAMTGWRIGAAIGPAHIIAMMGKIATNDEAMTCHFVQYAGLEILTNKVATAAYTANIVEKLRERRDVLVSLLREVPGFKPKVPKVTFYLFVNCTEAVKLTGSKGTEEFRSLILRETGVSFCTRQHFGQYLLTGRSLGMNQHFVRFAFSGIEVDQITEGIGKLRDFMVQCKARFDAGEVKPHPMSPDSGAGAGGKRPRT